MTVAVPRVPGAWRLDRVALNVGDLDAATRFYCEALGFELARGPCADPALARVLGVDATRTARLRRGRQVLELGSCQPPGAQMPPGGRSNDRSFQHCALVTDDIEDACARLRRFPCAPISRGGPQALPGGIVAFKFRDPDGHPLELIAFPGADPATAGGIDHSAICTHDLKASIDFYATHLGLVVQARQVNSGPAQDALDGLDGAVVDVVALAPAVPAPHVELLRYRQPRPRVGPTPHPADRIATRLVFAPATPRAGAADDAGLALLHDPDGHAVLLERHP